MSYCIYRGKVMKESLEQKLLDELKQAMEQQKVEQAKENKQKKENNNG